MPIDEDVADLEWRGVRPGFAELCAALGDAGFARRLEDAGLRVGPAPGTTRICSATVVRTGAKPNVLFLQDSSGSMEQGIYHPDYNPNTMLTTSASPDYGTINNATRTSWYIRWVKNTAVYTNTNYVTINSFTAPNTLVVNNKTTYIKAGDWILSYNGSDSENRSSQMVAKVTNVAAGAAPPPSPSTLPPSRARPRSITASIFVQATAAPTPPESLPYMEQTSAKMLLGITMA